MKHAPKSRLKLELLKRSALTEFNSRRYSDFLSDGKEKCRKLCLQIFETEPNLTCLKKVIIGVPNVPVLVTIQAGPKGLSVLLIDMAVNMDLKSKKI